MVVVQDLSLMHQLAFCAHSLWWDALLSLDAAGRGLVLPQFNEPDFVHSPRSLRGGLIGCVGEEQGKETVIDL